MIINTEHLTLRPFDKKDINSYYNIAQGDSVKKFAYPIYVESKEQAKERIATFQSLPARPDDYMFAIEEKANKVLIGAISATKMIENTLDISLFIAESCRNKGYAKEAINAMFSKFIELKKPYKLTFFVADTNYQAVGLARKIKVEAEKLGFVLIEARLNLEGTDYLLNL